MHKKHVYKLWKNINWQNVTYGFKSLWPMTSLRTQRGPCRRHLLMGLYVVSRVHSSVHIYTYETWIWAMAAFTYFKNSGTSGCKIKIDICLEFSKDSAKLKCHIRGSNYLWNNFEWLKKRPYSLDVKAMQLETTVTRMKRWIFGTKGKFICFSWEWVNVFSSKRFLVALGATVLFHLPFQ